MAAFTDLITNITGEAFEAAGYDSSYGRTNVSNRPDLCEFQCNGAMAAAKKYGKKPFEIANEVCLKLKENPAFSKAEIAGPGFINLDMDPGFISSYLENMASSEKLGVDVNKPGKKVIIDYGGPNVAKPLHIGHLRSAIIGESIKRTAKFMGDDVTGDIHLGDWGLQMGLIIASLSEKRPDLPYFDDGFEGEYPKEAPFTISELEKIYPEASARSKEDEAFRAKALEATAELQAGKPGYRAIWKHIMNVSVADLKKNYERLHVDFDLWKGESDVQEIMPAMVSKMVQDGYAYVDDGATIVDVALESDTKEMPPCMLLKSDGAALYTTTDLATIQERMELYDPDRIIYVVDKRQELHFDQVFRCAKKTGLVKDDTELRFLGFGTMNGKDGKPFKTRSGGVMRLESLLDEIEDEMLVKLNDNHGTDPDEAQDIAKAVALSAVKYGDLSNQASKDYIFDTEKFTSFEGNTGPYILYTIVRINSIIERFIAAGGDPDKCRMGAYASDAEKSLQLAACGFESAVKTAYGEMAPHKLCSYIYELSNELNRFYHETKILTEEDEEKKNGWVALIDLVRRILKTSIELLGFSAPEKM